MKRTFLRLTALLLLLSLLPGCAKIEEEDSWEDEIPSLMEQEEQEEPTLNISSFALPYLPAQTLDPVTCPDGVQRTVGSLLYEGLFVLDEQFTAQNVLCESYIFDPATLTYTFTLRENVHFSDGSALTAQDVLATYRRAMTSARYSARFKDVSSMRTRDANTLLITLTRANAALPVLLDIPIVKSGTETMNVPSGTGPYLFVNSSEGAALQENAAWWQKKELPLEQIPLVSAKDNETAAHRFSSYDAHFYLLDQTDSSLSLSSGKNDTTDVQTAVMQYLCVNTMRAPLTNATLRSAMLQRIDRSTLTLALLSGHASSAQFPLSPISSLYPHALEQALSADNYASVVDETLKQTTNTTLTLLVNAENDFKTAIAESLCAQLSTDVLTITCRTLPWAEYLGALESGNFDLALCEVQLTADWDLTALLSSTGTLNYSRHVSEETDALLSAFLADHSPVSANALYSHLLKTAPILPLLFKSESALTPAALVEGMQPTAANPFYRFEDWSFQFNAQ